MQHSRLQRCDDKHLDHVGPRLALEHVEWDLAEWDHVEWDHVEWDHTVVGTFKPCILEKPKNGMIN